MEIFLKVSTTFPYNALATDQVLMPKQETHFFLPSLYIPLAMSDRNNCYWSPQGDCDPRTLLGSSWIYSQPLPSDLVIVVRREIYVRGSSVQGEGFWAEESCGAFPQCPSPCWLAQSLLSSGDSRTVLLS